MPLALRTLANNDCAVIDDGHPVGRIRLASERSDAVWMWNITIPLPGGGSGTAADLDQAKQAFRKSWAQFKTAIAPGSPGARPGAGGGRPRPPRGGEPLGCFAAGQPPRKNIPVPFLFETPYSCIRLVPPEGRIAIVTDAEGDAMDAAMPRVATTWQGSPIDHGPVS